MENDMEFVVQLLKETGVLIAMVRLRPGIWKRPRKNRVLPPIEELEEAFDAIEGFMKKKQKDRGYVGYG